jgi:hypothetical protein
LDKARLQGEKIGFSGGAGLLILAVGMPVCQAQTNITIKKAMSRGRGSKSPFFYIPGKKNSPPGKSLDFSPFQLSKSPLLLASGSLKNPMKQQKSPGHKKNPGMTQKKYPGGKK